MAFDFSDLDLSQAHVQGGSVPPGRYNATIIKGEIKDSKSGNGKNLFVQFRTDVGVITAIFVVANTNRQAVEIGLDKLYTMLVYANHPSPKKPGSIASLRDLKVGIIVAQDGEYTRVNGFFKPEDKPAILTPDPEDEEDPIPF